VQFSIGRKRPLQLQLAITLPPQLQFVLIVLQLPIEVNCCNYRAKEKGMHRVEERQGRREEIQFALAYRMVMLGTGQLRTSLPA
jgi:hypothetical protein